MRKRLIALATALAFACLLDPNVAFASAVPVTIEIGADGAPIGTSGEGWTYADGKLTLQTRNQPKPQEIQVTRERLPDELKQLLTTLAADGKGSQPVVISGDKQVRYETILDVMGDIKQQGVARVGLMVKPRPTAPARSS